MIQQIYKLFLRDAKKMLIDENFTLTFY